MKIVSTPHINKKLLYNKVIQTMIKEYIRDDKYNPRGVVVAVKENNQVYYGYSLCNPRDKYDKETAMKIAINRALCEKGFNLPKVPATRQLIFDKFRSVEARALNYFKDIPQENVKIEFIEENLQP
jgi:hypothetical protein